MAEYHDIPGFPKYQMNDKGELMNCEGETLKPGENHCFRLLDEQGRRRKVSLKTLYRLVFEVEYSVETVDNLPGEEWIEMPGTEGRFFGSSKGRIKSLCQYKTRLLKPQDNGNGYLRVEIQGKKEYVHRIIGALFLGGPTPEQYTIDHKNGNKKDNSVENLQYLSLSDNIKEYYRRLKMQQEGESQE